MRELRNAVERLLFEGMISEDAEAGTGLATTSASDDAPIERYRDARAKAVASFEGAYFRALMSRCGDNASEAARRAGMDRPYLLSQLKKHGLR